MFPFALPLTLPALGNFRRNFIKIFGYINLSKKCLIFVKIAYCYKGHFVGFFATNHLILLENIKYFQDHSCVGAPPRH